MRKTLAVFVAGGLVAGAMLGSASPAQAAAAIYTIQDLGTLPGDYSSVAMGINQFGDVVGWSAGPTGTRAFVYTNGGGMTALPGPAGRPVSTARAINGNGIVVGTASPGGSDIGRAVRWQSGVAIDLGTLGSGSFSEARGVNATGTIVGSSSTDGGGLLGTHAFRYSTASGMVDITPGFDDAHAEGINDSGQIVGWRNGRAFRRTGTTFTDLGVPSGFAQSFAYAINGTGQVAGHVINGSGNTERIFRYANGVMTLIGGLGEYNRASGINAAGDVVGQGLPVLGLKQGFVYTDANGMQGLNQLIAPATGWYILGATGINDAGQIVGWASGPNGQRAVRLRPTDATATPPTAPSGLAAQAPSGAQVRLTWTDNAANELGFRVQRARGSQGTFVLIGSVAANVTNVHRYHRNRREDVSLPRAGLQRRWAVELVQHREHPRQALTEGSCRRAGSGGRTPLFQPLGCRRPELPALGDPQAGVAVAKIWDARGLERSEDEDPAMRSERQHVGNEPAIGEDLVRLALGVDEGLVEATTFDDAPHLREERGAGDIEAGADVGDGLVGLDAHVVAARVDHVLPHVHLADEPRQELPQRRIVIELLDRERDLAIERLVVDPCRQVDHLVHEPQVVLDHPNEQVHGVDLAFAGHAQAARWVEMDVVRGVQLDLPRLGPPGRRRDAVRALERPREGLVRGVAGVDRQPKDAVATRGEPERRALEQDPTPERNRRLACGRPDHPIEVIPGQVQLRRPVLRPRLVVVQVRGQNVEEAGEGVGLRVHVHHAAPPEPVRLDRVC